MTNPTSNYGFVLPNSADLVTDLPADFDVALQGVDTRLKALQPGTTLGDLAFSSATANTNTRVPIGTTGQVLAVVAGVPAWQNGTTGDIEGVTAGVGISGGGTSGTVTVTNSMATAITTAGDLIKGTGSGTFDRLGIGSTGQVLTVAAGVPSWATAAAGGMTQIATGSLSGSQVNITSIPTTYIDLTLIVRDYAPTNNGYSLRARFNNDSNARYGVSFRTISTQDQTFASTNMQIGDVGQSTGDNLYYWQIQDYANTTTWKMGFVNSINPNSTNAANYDYGRYTSFYNQTPAITEINLFPNSGGGNFTSGTYILYGVK